MTNRAVRLLPVTVTLMVSACTLDQTPMPALTGPSAFSTTIQMSANPDTLALGQSATVPGQQSLVIVTALDVNGAPKPNQMLRVETLVNGSLSDCGQVSQSVLVTGADGKASTVFTAPGTPPDCARFSTDGSVTIRATPVGTDFQASSSTTASVALFMAAPTFGATTGPFSVNFSISPNPAKPNTEVTFSDSGSISPGHSLSTFRWTWSDGASKGGSTVTHDFGAAGTYTVTLTVTDDAGQTAFKTALVTIAD